MPWVRPGAGSAIAGWLTLQLDVVLQAHAFDHSELGLQKIDMFFLAFEDAFEDLAADIIAHRFRMKDRFLEERDGFQFQREIGLEHFLDIFAHLEFVDRLEVRKTIEE